MSLSLLAIAVQLVLIMMITGNDDDIDGDVSSCYI